MRLISRLLLFWLLALCCGPLAIAQAADPMEVMQSIPAEGPVNPPSSVTTLQADKAQAVEHYDLQGRRIDDITSAHGIIITRNADGTVTKMLKN